MQDTKNIPEILKQENYDKSRRNRIITSSCNIFCHVSFIIAIIVVLAIDRSACKYPIRAWLIIYACLSIVGTLCSLFIEIVIKQKHFESRIISRLYGFYYCIMICFFITWTILGSVWVYVDGNCEEDFNLGWKLIVAILAIQYVIFVLCSCAGCVGLVYALAIRAFQRKDVVKNQVEDEGVDEIRDKTKNPHLE